MLTQMAMDEPEYPSEIVSKHLDTLLISSP